MFTMTKKKAAGFAGVALLSATVLTGCSDKTTEQFKDAHINSRNSSGADVGTMPDGFSNFATKCDHGYRVWVIFKSDNSYGSISTQHDKNCPQPKGNKNN